MKTLTVALADLEGTPHGTASARTNVTVTARYTGDVVLTSGKIIPPAIKVRQLPTSGVAEFEVYESDSTLVKAEYRGFAIRVEATIRQTGGGPPRETHVTRTVKVLSSASSPISLGTLSPAEPLPPQWATVSEVVGDFDERLTDHASRIADLEESPSGGGDVLTPATGVTPLPAAAEPGSLLGFRVTGSATFTHSTGSVALAEGAYVFERVGGTWVYRALVAASGLTPPAPDTTPPSAGSLAASAIAATSFTLTATGASDNSALHALPYAFSSDNGSTWSAYQTSAAFNVTGKVASTAYQCRHRVRDAAGNVSTGTTITVTTTTTPTTMTYSESFTRANGTNLVGLLTEVGGAEMHNSAFWTSGLDAGDMAPVVNGGRLIGVADQGPRCAIAPTVAAGQVLTHSIDYDLTSGAGNRQVRIKVGPLGDAFAMFYVTATGEVKNSSNVTVHSGAPLAGRIGIRANGTSRALLINGAVVHTATVTAALVGAEQFCAFAVYGSGASVDNWSVVIA